MFFLALEPADVVAADRQRGMEAFLLLKLQLPHILAVVLDVVHVYHGVKGDSLLVDVIVFDVGR